MDANEKKRTGVILGGAAVIAVLAARLGAPSQPEPPAPPPVMIRTVQVDRATGSALGSAAFIVFDGDLEMPLGTECTIGKGSNARTASCTLRDERELACEAGSAGWGCKAASAKGR